MILFLSLLRQMRQHERGTRFNQRPTVVLGPDEHANGNTGKELEHVHTLDYWRWTCDQNTTMRPTAMAARHKTMGRLYCGERVTGRSPGRMEGGA